MIMRRPARVEAQLTAVVVLAAGQAAAKHALLGPAVRPPCSSPTLPGSRGPSGAGVRGRAKATTMTSALTRAGI